MFSTTLRFLITVSLLFFLPLPGNADEYDDALSPIFEQGTKNVKLGKMKGQKVSGSYTGMGAIQLKKGGYYIGDINDGQPDGYGFMINPTDVAGQGKGGIFAGRFKKGIVDGNGTLYTPEGFPIGKGKIAQGMTPAALNPSDSEFVTIEVKDGCNFIGEARDFLPNGIGALVWEDGTAILGSFDNGNPSGVVVTLLPSGDWQSENIHANGSTVLSSSDQYRQLADARKVKTWDLIHGILIMMAQTTNTINEGVQKYAEAEEIKYESRAAAIDSDDSDYISSDGSLEYYKNKYWRLARKIKNLWNRSYEAHQRHGETLIKDRKDGKVGASDVRSASNSYQGYKGIYESYRSRMHSIYNMAQKKGYSFKKSYFHDRPFSSLDMNSVANVNDVMD